MNGPLNLAGNLAVKLTGPVTAGQKLTLIHDTGPGATGTFAGLAEGAKVTADGSVFQISYQGGSGHDVVLTAISVSASGNANAGPGIGGSASSPHHGGAGVGAATSLILVALGALLAGLLTIFVIARKRRPATEAAHADRAPLEPDHSTGARAHHDEDNRDTVFLESVGGAAAAPGTGTRRRKN